MYKAANSFEDISRVPYDMNLATQKQIAKFKWRKQ